MTRFDELLTDPSAHFTRPDAVLQNEELDTVQKRRLLEAWRAEAERLIESADEGMAGGETPPLVAIDEALDQLERETASDVDHRLDQLSGRLGRA